MTAAFVIFTGILTAYAAINIRRGGFCTKEVVLLGMLVTMASTGRVAFNYSLHIPSLQPASFVIIASGMMLGGMEGFIVGSMTGFVSNLFLGLGPYTPWQMALWGIMGLSAAMVKGKSRPAQAAFGFIWGFLFGWIMNIPYFSMGIIKFTWPAYLASCGLSFTMDLTHALINAVLLAIFSDGWLARILSATHMELKRS